MSNRQYDFTLAAQLGATQRLDVTGSKVKVLTSPAGPVGIKVDGGPEVSLLEGQGFSMPPGKTFRDVLIRNQQAVANVGAIFIGDEGFEDSRISGNVRIIDEITDNITTALQVGATALTAFTAVQILAPAANVRGMIVRMASAGGAAGAGGTTSARITAAKSAPTAFFTPAQCFQLVESFNSQAADSGVTQRMNKYLPPGWGLYLTYAISTAVPVTSPSGVVQFELL